MRSIARVALIHVTVLTLPLIVGCGEEDTSHLQQPFDGATHVIAPESDYFLTLPDEPPVYRRGKPAGAAEDVAGGETDGAAAEVDTSAEEAAAAVTGPTPDGQFRGGTKVKLVEEVEHYTKVETADGQQAWVPSKAVKKDTPEG